jgi:hypothetical protein
MFSSKFVLHLEEIKIRLTNLEHKIEKILWLLEERTKKENTND